MKRPQRRPVAEHRLSEMWRLAAAAAAVAALLGGCGSPQEPAASLPEGFGYLAEQSLLEATGAGASADQLAEITRAIETGEVTLEDSRAAIGRVVECFEEAGLDPTSEDRVLPNGLTIPSYMVGPGDVQPDAVLPLIDACEARESKWTDMLYQLQPSSVETNLAYIAQQEPVIRACLEEAGFVAEDDATPLEVVIYSGEVAIDTAGSVDCAADSGVFNY